MAWYTTHAFSEPRRFLVSSNPVISFINAIVYDKLSVVLNVSRGLEGLALILWVDIPLVWGCLSRT